MKPVLSILFSFLLLFIVNSGFSQSNPTHLLLGGRNHLDKISMDSLKMNPSVATDSKKVKLQSFTLWYFADATHTKTYTGLNSISADLLKELEDLVSKFPAGVWISLYDVKAGKGKHVSELEALKFKLTKS